ncbi:signal peptide peptidase SppA [Rhodoplanes sp. Z2-YC6860]|uniref:signal peptide peptidase SppA n=1 Tax=Rhodoplanes sp. Z2-YC6860 TaxID=674703 RepID=UPI00078B9E82|nr:signal peptide peptidase SppA [Rhodoplanes sp. Z2-YC6860]AMN38826.1 S49 family peptidase [Rhodoplanes sp. Z2-YC6860]
MSLDADQIVDRRRMRRKLTFWRAATIFILIAAVVGGGWIFAERRGAITPMASGSIARVTIEGLIRNNRTRTEALTRLAESDAKAVIVHINSPGGTVAGSEELYDSLMRLKAKKPMVVVVDGLAASGGYIAAMASDRILAQQSSIVGSIGVIFQFPNFTELLKTVGVQVESIKSAPLKASPNGLEPTTPEARAAVESLVKDSFDWFKGLVHDRRGLDQAAVEKVSDGRVYTGRQALELKLIDALGDEFAAVDWLAKEKGINPKTPVRDYRLSPRFGDLPFLHTGAVWMLDAVGLGGLAERFKDLGAVQAMERLNLDGLLALWHPSATN